MFLYFSGSSHLNATYRSEDSQALYKVQCPHPLTADKPIVKVGRAIPNTRSRDYPNFRDLFVPWAEIDFSRKGSTVLRLGEKEEVSTKEFFTRRGRGWYSKHRIFTAPDGQQYRWELTDVSKLYLNDKGSRKTLVARSHRRRFGVLHKRREACLEILPGGERILDTIVMTFVYVEKKRKDVELIMATA